MGENETNTKVLTRPQAETMLVKNIVELLLDIKGLSNEDLAKLLFTLNGERTQTEIIITGNSYA